MPNYVTNIITVNGASEQKSNLFEQIAFDGCPRTFDFNKVIPMPPSLDLTEGTIRDDAINAYLSAINPGNLSDLPFMWKASAKQYAAAVDDAKAINRYRIPKGQLDDMEVGELADAHKMKSPEALIDLGKQYLDNYREHGAATWYGWRRQHWGTKWNNDPESQVVDEKEGLICFLTAWSAPAPIVKELSRQHPELILSISWADEDLGQNVGRAVYQKGEVVDKYIPEPGSLEALELACEIEGLPFEEVIEERFPELLESAFENSVHEKESLDAQVVEAKETADALREKEDKEIQERSNSEER